MCTVQTYHVRFALLLYEVSFSSDVVFLQFPGPKGDSSLFHGQLTYQKALVDIDQERSGILICSTTSVSSLEPLASATSVCQTLGIFLSFVGAVSSNGETVVGSGVMSDICRKVACIAHIA